MLNLTDDSLVSVMGERRFGTSCGELLSFLSSFLSFSLEFALLFFSFEVPLLVLSLELPLAYLSLEPPLLPLSLLLRVDRDLECLSELELKNK